MKVQTVQSARKPPGRCESCGKDIGVGGSYKYVKPRYGARRVRHVDCPMWRPSELASGKIATAYATQEAAHDALEAMVPPADWEDAAAFRDDVTEVLNDCATGAGDCRDEYQEGYDNMPENFQAGPTGEEIQEKIDMLESWASELEDADLPEVPEGVEPAAEVPCPDCGEVGEPQTIDDRPTGTWDCTNDDCKTGEYDADTTEDPDAPDIEDWVEDVLTTARDLIDGLEL